MRTDIAIGMVQTVCPRHDVGTKSAVDLFFDADRGTFGDIVDAAQIRGMFGTGNLWHLYHGNVDLIV